MESRQAVKEERAEAAARVAADELHDVNKERRDQSQREYEQKPGVIGSIIKSVQGTLGHAKDAVTGKAHDTAAVTSDTTSVVAENATQSKDAAASKMGEYADYAKEKDKAVEYKDYAADKAKQAKDTTMDKAKEAKNTTMQKTEEYKDYTAEKAKDGKDVTVGKLTELKDSAADAARRAMDMLTGKKEETKEKAGDMAEAAKQKAEDTAEVTKQKAEETAGAAKQKAKGTNEAAKEKYHETEEATRRKMDEMKLQESHDENKAASGGIFGVLGGMKDAIKDTLAPKHTTDETIVGGSKLAVDVEDTRAGKTAATLKNADQVTGHTFNDVGRMDVEGISEVEAKDSTGKNVKVKY
ncbi:hypothetical protein K7X08_014255 [Anisodus acutangulus]|uniref:Late embryogenesis abundant protein ECP63-like domain-containing protein n=1 Tax=Anisodus acutangulus TaxID=402998 RepID=A0A9Q1R2Q5_9SOLA|nr:hypothetical protein K7X08_014255 [Anisodus acutangulus]